MTSARGLLSELASAVADGEVVDWSEARRRLESTPGAGAMTGLEFLDRLGRQARASSRVEPGRKTLVCRLPPHLGLLAVLVAVQGSLAVTIQLIGPAALRPVPPALMLATSVGFFAAAGFLLVAGREDPRTRPLAGFFLGVASAATLPFLSRLWTVPPLAEFSPWLSWTRAFLPECFLPFFLWCFVREFPRVVRFDRWSRWVAGSIRTSGWVGLFLFALNALHRLGDPVGLDQSGFLAGLLRGSASSYWVVLFLLAMPALPVALLRLPAAEVEERQRFRFFLVALGLGVLPLFVLVTAETVIAPLGKLMSRPGPRIAGSVLVYGALLTIPVTTTYATVAQQVLSLRLVVHRAARLTLARGTLLGLAALPWVLLALSFWRRRDQSLVDLLATSPTSQLLLAGLGGAMLYLMRRRLLSGLERRLLGRKVKSSRVLASFMDGVSVLRGLPDLVDLARRHAADLIQAQSLELYVFSDEDRAYLPTDRSRRALEVDTATGRLAAAVPEPFSVDPRDRDSMLPWLPEPERQWASDGEVHLIVPLVSPSGDRRGLLTLGPSRSGLPYAADDREAASALGSAACLALQRLGFGAEAVAGGAAPGAPDQPAGECRSCLRVVERPGDECTCGSRLEPAAIPLRLAGKFRVDLILGQGGMGLVYRATDLTLDRQVALKTLPRLRSEALWRLRREARSMASFIHPNLALIFGAETWRGVPILIVEYMEGGTLKRRLDRPLPPRTVVELGLKLAGALNAMHERGLLHRDVKPANIGFTADGEPKLLDFGLARIVEEARIRLDWPSAEGIEPGAREDHALITRTHHVVGTPLYLSPEVLEGRPATPAQDLWSLHLVLWEALAGRHPYRVASGRGGLRRLRRGSVPGIRSVVPDCPRAIAELLARGLDRRPRRRPQSAGEVRRELAATLEVLSSAA